MRIMKFTSKLTVAPMFCFRHCGAYLLIVLLCGMQLICGCFTYTYSSNCKTEKTEYALQSVMPRCTLYRSWSSELNIRIKARTAAVYNDQVVYDDKIACGLFPGLEMHLVDSTGTDTAVGFIPFGCLLATPFMLGLNCVDALLFEPFRDPCKEDDGTRFLRTSSPVGFCKYRIPRYKDRPLSNYTIEVNGRTYSTKNNGFDVIIPREKDIGYGSKLKIKLTSEPVDAAGVRLEGLAALVGAEFEVTVQD